MLTRAFYLPALLAALRPLTCIAPDPRDGNKYMIGTMFECSLKGGD